MKSSIFGGSGTPYALLYFGRLLNTNSCKSKDDLREYNKFNVAHKMLKLKSTIYSIKLNAKITI